MSCSRCVGLRTLIKTLTSVPLTQKDYFFDLFEMTLMKNFQSWCIIYKISQLFVFARKQIETRFKNWISLKML